MELQLFDPYECRYPTEEGLLIREMCATMATFVCLLKKEDPAEWIVYNRDNCKGDLIGEVFDTSACGESPNFTSTAPILVQRWQLYKKEVDALQEAIQAQIDVQSYIEEKVASGKKNHR